MQTFVYRWRNVSTREWYVGLHTGTADDGYICSSVVARPRIQAQPDQWQRRILRWGTRSDMIDLERRILSRLRARNNPRSLNRSNGNGTERAGRPPGTPNQHSDLRVKNLRGLGLGVVDLLVQETDPHRRFLIHRYIFGIVTEQKTKKSVGAKYTHENPTLQR